MESLLVQGEKNRESVLVADHKSLGPACATCSETRLVKFGTFYSILFMEIKTKASQPNFLGYESIGIPSHVIAKISKNILRKFLRSGTEVKTWMRSWRASRHRSWETSTLLVHLFSGSGSIAGTENVPGVRKRFRLNTNSESLRIRIQSSKNPQIRNMPIGQASENVKRCSFNTNLFLSEHHHLCWLLRVFRARNVHLGPKN